MQLFVIEYYMDGEKTFPSSFEIIIIVITIIITIAHMDVGGVNTNAKTHLNEAESYDFECDNDDFDVAVARRLERLRRRSGQRSGDSHRSLDFKTASQSLQSPQSLE